MSILLRFSVAAILSMSVTSAISEEVFWGPGKIRVLPFGQKIERGSRDAVLVAVGKFRPLGKSQQVETYATGEAFLQVEFQIERIIKAGNPDENKTILLKIPIAIRLAEEGAHERRIQQRELDLERDRGERFEKDSGGKLMEKKTYDEAMLEVRDKLLQSDKYLRDFVLVPIRVGGLDTPYRVTNVPVNFGSSYVLFLFKQRPSGSDAMAVFPWELDIYRSEKSVLQILGLHG